MTFIFIWLYLYIIPNTTYNTVIESESPPRDLTSHAIGYDRNNKIILLFGGVDHRKQFVKFDTKTYQFIDVNATYLTHEIWGNGQFFSQQDDILWIMKPINGVGSGFLTVNTQRYIETDPALSIPVAVGYVGCLVAMDRYLFIAGGGGGTDRVQVYNITSTTWFNAPSLQTPRKACACLAVKNKLYIIGGKHNDMMQAFDTIEQLDIEQTFNSQPSPPQWVFINGTLSKEIAHSTSVQYGDYILVIGGMTFNNAPTSEIHSIDTNTGSVDVVGSLARGTGQSAAIIVDGTLFVFGGYSARNIYQHATLPTMKPTNEPTIDPTVRTLDPTMNPTSSPTSNPTSSPTLNPTNQPIATLDPTTTPTPSPSLSPTPSPSAFTTPNSKITTETDIAGDDIAGENQPEKVDLILIAFLSLIILTICILLIVFYRWFHIYKANNAQMKMMVSPSPVPQPQKVNEPNHVVEEDKVTDEGIADDDNNDLEAENTKRGEGVNNNDAAYVTKGNTDLRNYNIEPDEFVVEEDDEQNTIR